MGGHQRYEPKMGNADGNAGRQRGRTAARAAGQWAFLYQYQRDGQSTPDGIYLPVQTRQKSDLCK